MIRRGGRGEQHSDRALVETVMAALLEGAPAGWRTLHAEFEPTALPLIATAVAELPDGRSQPVPVPPLVLASVSDYQRRDYQADKPWRRLTIDVDCYGKISATTDSDPLRAGDESPERRSRLAIAFAVVTAGCVVASVVLFTVAWKWSPPPRADLVAVPAPSPREQEAFTVASQWYAAENNRDVTTMRELACADPAQSVRDWISTIDSYGQDQGLVFPDAVTQFEDDGTTARVKIAVRIRPLDDRMKAQVAEVQEKGGFFHEIVTLADNGGRLKVCDVERPQ